MWMLVPDTKEEKRNGGQSHILFGKLKRESDGGNEVGQTEMRASRASTVIVNRAGKKVITDLPGENITSPLRVS